MRRSLAARSRWYTRANRHLALSDWSIDVSVVLSYTPDVLRCRVYFSVDVTKETRLGDYRNRPVSIGIIVIEDASYSPHFRFESRFRRLTRREFYRWEYKFRTA